MKASEKTWVGIIFAIMLALCAGNSFATEASESQPESPAPVKVEKAQEVKAPEAAPAQVDAPALNTFPWAHSLLDDHGRVEQNGSCGQCNCNEDDDCQAICGKPASCERRICPCATCTGSCQC